MLARRSILAVLLVPLVCAGELWAQTGEPVKGEFKIWFKNGFFMAVDVGLVCGDLPPAFDDMRAAPGTETLEFSVPDPAFSEAPVRVSLAGDPDADSFIQFVQGGSLVSTFEGNLDSVGNLSVEIRSVETLGDQDIEIRVGPTEEGQVLGPFTRTVRTFAMEAIPFYETAQLEADFTGPGTQLLRGGLRINAEAERSSRYDSMSQRGEFVGETEIVADALAYSNMGFYHFLHAQIDFHSPEVRSIFGSRPVQIPALVAIEQEIQFLYMWAIRSPESRLSSGDLSVYARHDIAGIRVGLMLRDVAVTSFLDPLGTPPRAEMPRLVGYGFDTIRRPVGRTFEKRRADSLIAPGGFSNGAFSLRGDGYTIRYPSTLEVVCGILRHGSVALYAAPSRLYATLHPQAPW